MLSTQTTDTAARRTIGIRIDASCGAGKPMNSLSPLQSLATFLPMKRFGMV